MKLTIELTVIDESARRILAALAGVMPVDAPLMPSNVEVSVGKVNPDTVPVTEVRANAFTVWAAEAKLEEAKANVPMGPSSGEMSVAAIPEVEITKKRGRSKKSADPTPVSDPVCEPVIHTELTATLGPTPPTTAQKETLRDLLVKVASLPGRSIESTRKICYDAAGINDMKSIIQDTVKTEAAIQALRVALA